MQMDSERKKGRSCLRTLLCHKKQLQIRVPPIASGFFYYGRVKRQIKTQQLGPLLSKQKIKSLTLSQGTSKMNHLMFVQ